MQVLPDNIVEGLIQRMLREKHIHQCHLRDAILHFAFVVPEPYYFEKQQLDSGLDRLGIGRQQEDEELNGLLIYEWLLTDSGGGTGTYYRMEAKYRMHYESQRPGLEPPTKEGSIVGPLVFFVEAGKPRSAHLQLAEVFTSLRGELGICDPYYGTGSLLRLDTLAHCGPVRMLTQTADSAEQLWLPRALTEFIREHRAFEFRRYAGRDLHDRYILTANELILLGHGLKDVGRRESFIVRLRRETAGDLIDDLRASFDSKWAAASPLT